MTNEKGSSYFLVYQNGSSSLVYEVLPWGLITVHYEQTYNHEIQYEQSEQYPGIKFAQPAAQLFPIGDPSFTIGRICSFFRPRDKRDNCRFIFLLGTDLGQQRGFVVIPEFLNLMYLVIFSN